MVPTYVDGKLVYEGVTDAAIKALLGFGSEMGGEIRSLSDYYKLYAITGEDIDTLEEIAEVLECDIRDFFDKDVMKESKK